MSRLDMMAAFAAQNPTDPFPRYALALEYRSLGKLHDSWNAFRELLDAHPDYTAAYLHAGGVLVQLGMADEARSVYQRGIEECGKRGESHARESLVTALQQLDA